MNLGFVFVIIGFACVALIQNNEASRILCVFPSPSKSHLLIHLAIAEALADAGHEVTVVATIATNSSIINTKSPQNYQLLTIEGPTFDLAFAQQMVKRHLPLHQRVFRILEQIFDLANATMNHPKMLNFLNSHKAGDFDAVILGYFMKDFMLGLGAHFQCPLIMSFMIQPIFPINRMLGNPPETSYVPNLYTGLRQPMNFWARVKNQLSSLFEQQVLAAIMAWKVDKLYR